MKKTAHFKSIYFRFVITFLLIWWLLNSLTFGFISHVVLSQTPFFTTENFRDELSLEMEKTRFNIGLVFLTNATIGTLIILLVVRDIVKPINLLSKASKEVATGNFDIEVKIKGSDEIAQLTADFNLMTKELKNIDVLRKDFVSNVSHEFKTPITSINGYAKLIKGGKITHEQLIEYCDIIESESQRLSLLSSNLLRLSELDNKIIRDPVTLFSLDEQIRKSILILESLWTKKNIDFEINLDQTTLFGDEHLIQQVWLNLIQNAIKFSHENGIIIINLYKNQSSVTVDIIDNGIGISEEDKQYIFKRFYKSDKSRSKEGNGLGLVIASKIVELSQGKIYFESELGKGSIFSVELPV